MKADSTSPLPSSSPVLSWLEVYEPEWEDAPGEIQSCLKVRRWTSAPTMNRHLYFTTPSLTEDGRWLVVLSERDEGHPNLFALDRRDGKLYRLTENHEGTLRSYVYPSSNVTGLSKSAPVLCAKTGRIYGIHGHEVFEVDIASRIRRSLFQLPETWWTGYVDVSSDGRKLCVPCVPPSAYTPEMKTQWDQLRCAHERMQERHLSSRLYEYDLHNHTSRVLVDLPFWCTHVSYAPDSSGDLIACAEGSIPAQGGAFCRIWKVTADGEFSRLFDQPKGLVVCHENWHPKKREIIYHGKDLDGSPFMEVRSWTGECIARATCPTIPVAHTVVADDSNTLYSDTRDGRIIRMAASNGKWVVEELLSTAQEPDWLRNQDAHFHPRLSVDQRSLVFSSHSADGNQIYELQIS